MNDILSREETLRELRLTEPELVRLVARRLLSALRAQDTTKFSRQEVDRIKESLRHL